MDHFQQPLTLVIDQGSHASRTALFTAQGELISLASKDVSTQSLQQGWYEQDASEILLSVTNLLHELKSANPDGKNPTQTENIKNCCLCTQRSSIVAWDKQTGTPLSPVISWRDLRNQSWLDNMDRRDFDIQRITGLPLSGHYSASKIRWLLDNNTDVQGALDKQRLCIAPLASFLLFHLLQGNPFLIDHTNAQRSQLFDINSLSWSDELLQAFNIDESLLPETQPVSYPYGKLSILDIPMTAVCGDQNAAWHAYPTMQLPKAVINIGTGAFIMSSAREKAQKPLLLRSIINSSENSFEYTTEGTVNGAGAAISWLQNRYPCHDLFEQLPDWLSRLPCPPVFINTVSGLGSPWWCTGGEPEFMSHNITLAERYVSAIESIIFLLYKNIQQLETTPAIFFISGGLSQLDGLCQRLADLSNAKVIRFCETQSSARGCAWLANQIVNENETNQASKAGLHKIISPKIEKEFTPQKNKLISKRYEQFVGELNRRCYND